jgi:hypothetical protein
MADQFYICESDEVASESLAHLFDQMKRAGWIESVIRTAEGKIMPQMTRLGKERFGQLLSVRNELDPEGRLSMNDVGMLYFVATAAAAQINL